MTDQVPTRVQLRMFVDDLESSLSFDPGFTVDCDDIILCGVGGSAVSGDFAADCCFDDSLVHIRLVKYPDLPNWVGPRTMAVVSSYSGNTAETLEMYRQAKARGCTVVAVTSGGALMDRATAAGDRILSLPKGLHPRHAIGHMIGYTLAVIRAAGGPDLTNSIRSFIPSLRGYRDSVSAPDGLARPLASALEGKVPVICSDRGMRSVAFRWKTQINENSKYVAFCEHVPEMTEMIRAWSTTRRGNYVLVALRDMSSEGSAMGDLLEAMRGSGAEAIEVRLEGSTRLENMFRGIILGDYVSVIMADDRGIDAAEVRPVMQMKEKLGKLGYRSFSTHPRTP